MAGQSVPRIGFLYDSNEQNLSLLQNLNVTLENPLNSGKKIIIEGYSFINQASGLLMANFIHMPTNNLPTTQLQPFPFMVPTTLNNDNVGIFRVGKTAQAAPMSGGSAILGLPLEPSARNYVESTPLTLMPGVILGLSISAVIAAKITVAIYTREEGV